MRSVWHPRVLARGQVGERVSDSKPISLRLPDDVSVALDRACAELGCTKSAFVVEAIRWALERSDEPQHVPAVIEDATIVINRRGQVRMPARRVMPRTVGRVNR